MKHVQTDDLIIKLLTRKLVYKMLIKYDSVN